MSYAIALAVWRERAPAALPAGVELMDSYAPLPIARVGGEQQALAELRALPEVASVQIGDSDKLAIVEGVARLAWRFVQLSARSPNGYPSRDLYSQGAYPILAGTDVSVEPGVTRIAPMAHAAVTNLSLGGPAWLRDELEPGDALRVAVEHASRIAPVVVAVGNDGHRPGPDTRTGLARLDATVAVGATEDDEGTMLYARSSTGAPGGPGPFVCASKWSIHDQPDPGTSFAAARVSREVVVLTAFLLTLRRALDGDDHPEGLPLAAVGMVDSGGFSPRAAESRLPIPAYPLGLGVDAEAVRAAAPAGFEVTGELALRALARSARPIPGCEPHQVGHGFVSEATTEDYLARFDAAEFAAVLGTDPPAGGAAPRLTTGEIGRAIAVWALGALFVYWNFDAGKGTEA
jgi:hypothetical protein